MSLDANGFTVFTFTTGRYIYVSNAGLDTNDGLTVSTPVKTIGKAVSLLTNLQPDWVLLRKGDTFTIDGTTETGWGTNFVFLNGKSSTEPMLFSSYETAQPGVPNPYTVTARPIIRVQAGNIAVQCTRGGSGSADNLAFAGLDFYSYQRDPGNVGYAGSTAAGTYGMYWLQTTTSMLIEDCVFRFHEKGISINPTTTNSGTTIRRCIFTDSWSSSTNSVGIFANNYQNFMLEQNLFDENGFDGPPGSATHTRNIRSRNVYLSSYGVYPATFTNNICTNSGSEGLQIRTGGTVSDNLFVACPIGFRVNGSEISDGVSVQNTNSSTVSDNVVLNSNDMNQSVANGGTTNYGYGIAFDTNGGPVNATSNIVAHETSAGANGIAMQTVRVPITGCANNGSGLIRVTASHGLVTGAKVTIAAVTGTTEANGTWTVTVIDGTHFDLQGSTFTHAYVSGGSFGATSVNANNSNIIYDWTTGVQDTDSQNTFAPVVDLTGANTEGYPNPGANTSPGNDRVGAYYGSVGGSPATLAGFIAAARAQTKNGWNTNFTADAANAYIRNGFGLSIRRGGKHLGKF